MNKKNIHFGFGHDKCRYCVIKGRNDSLVEKLSAKKKQRKHRRPTCQCGWSAVNYSEKYDAYYCPLCCEWVDNKCADPGCVFCVNRPSRPMEEWYIK